MNPPPQGNPMAPTTLGSSSTGDNSLTNSGMYSTGTHPPTPFPTSENRLQICRRQCQVPMALDGPIASMLSLNKIETVIAPVPQWLVLQPTSSSTMTYKVRPPQLDLQLIQPPWAPLATIISAIMPILVVVYGASSRTMGL